jgi:hypothetical protein
MHIRCPMAPEVAVSSNRAPPNSQRRTTSVFGKPQRLPNPADTIARAGLSVLTKSWLDEVRLP